MSSIILQEKSNLTKPISIILLVPNLIGYLRILFLIIGVITAFYTPLTAFFSIFISANLDAVDGYLARKLQQESKIGSILDYATDRATDIAIYILMVMLYPHAWMFFCIMLMIDIFSHICQVYSTVFTNVQSHKELGKGQGPLLRLYYSKRSVLYFACAFYSLWFGSLYIYHFYPNGWVLLLSLLCLPGFIFKVMVHLLQIAYVFRVVALCDINGSNQNLPS